MSISLYLSIYLSIYLYIYIYINILHIYIYIYKINPRKLIFITETLVEAQSKQRKYLLPKDIFSSTIIIK